MFWLSDSRLGILTTCIAAPSGNMILQSIVLLIVTVSSSHSLQAAKYQNIYSSNGQGLVSVPSVPPDTQVLSLSFNRISSISPDSFQNLLQLQVLNLGGQITNGFFYVEKSAFIKVTNLTALDLGSNRNLRLHPDSFRGLSRLETLLLDHCGLNESILESGFLGELTSLKKLDLSYNNLRRLQPDSSFLGMHSLSYIILKLNKISDLCGDDLQNLRGRRLELLDLSSNPLQIPNRSMCHNPFRNITLGTLDISSMAWNAEKVENFFKIISGTQVKHVRMRNTAVLGSGYHFRNVKNPEKSTFSGLHLSNVYIFDISRSYISELPSDIFSVFPSLLSLDLSSSQINQISPGAFSGLTQLISLNMSGNLIGEITRNSFSSLSSSPLITLDLSSNHIGVIQYQALNSLISLDSLSLRDNALTEIPLVELLGLQFVSLKQNRISSPVGLTSFCPNCTFVDLSSNRMTDLRSLWEILKLRSLKQLLLGSNELSWCSPNTTKLFNSSLLYLDLSDNDLGQVWNHGQCSDIFIPLASLETLNLAKNQIFSLPESLFSELKSLQTLDLSRNNLRLLHQDLFIDLRTLKSLNIGGNYLVTLSSSSFTPLVSLQSLDLSDISPICTCALNEFWHWIISTKVMVKVNNSSEISCLSLSPSVREIPMVIYFNEC
ncbi:toll-like receptor 5 isoform X1 [Dendrobates tinctorius]|uniref:toll-like receptor 5 isoform X1 n=2 Tax=Dendrobates tinctorius TaxID=92724 RepID=UPI003CC9E457